MLSRISDSSVILLTSLVTGSTDNLSVSSETAISFTIQNDSSTTELKTDTNDNTGSSHSDSKEDEVNDDSPSLLDTSPQCKTTDYGIELSQEDKVILLVQTADSKLSDIQ